MKKTHSQVRATRPDQEGPHRPSSRLYDTSGVEQPAVQPDPVEMDNKQLLPGQAQGPHGDAGWSSPVARQAHNLKVVGSNPTPATNTEMPRPPQDSPRRLFCACFLQVRCESRGSRSFQDMAPKARTSICIRGYLVEVLLGSAAASSSTSARSTICHPAWLGDQDATAHITDPFKPKPQCGTCSCRRRTWSRKSDERQSSAMSRL
jgi:hypothetical protein